MEQLGNRRFTEDNDLNDGFGMHDSFTETQKDKVDRLSLTQNFDTRMRDVNKNSC